MEDSIFPQIASQIETMAATIYRPAILKMGQAHAWEFWLNMSQQNNEATRDMMRASMDGEQLADEKTQLAEMVERMAIDRHNQADAMNAVVDKAIFAALRAVGSALT